MKITQYGPLTVPAANDELLAVDVNDLTMSSTGTTKNVTLATLLPGVVWPSGSATGAKDVANVLAAIASDGAATLMPGTYYGNSTVTYGLGQVVQGLAGPPATRWNNVGSTPAFTIVNPGSYDGNTPAILKGLRIDGAGATAAANAFEVGDINRVEIDAWLSNWTGGSVAALMKNRYWWTEQAKVKLYLQNCDNAVRLDQSGAGTNSFARCDFDLYFNQSYNSQNGLILAGSGTTGVSLYEGSLRMRGNWSSSSGAVTSSVISFITENAQMLSVEMQIGLEVNGSGTHTPQTINFKDSSTTIQDGWGNIAFLASPNPWTPSNNNLNMWFNGGVSGDDTLVGPTPAYQPTKSVYINSGLPSGWTGSINLQAPRGDGLVFANFALTVASGTVLTNFETVYTGIPTWARPTDNRTILVATGTTIIPIIISPAGNIIYNGATVTPGSNMFPYGQAWYVK